MVIPNWWEVKENQYQDSRVNLFNVHDFMVVDSRLPTISW